MRHLAVRFDGEYLPLYQLGKPALRNLLSDGNLSCPMCDEGTLTKKGTCRHCGSSIWQEWRMARAAAPKESRT